MTHDLSQHPEYFWENLYRDRRQDTALWGSRVNPRLAEVAADLPAGAALDLGCGAGGDTMWLARRGWRVTAVDISPTAVAQILRLAQQAGLGDLVTAERHDLAHTFPDGSFDLVSAQYFHTPFALPRAAILRAAAQALRPGGRLLVVDHGSIAPWSWNQDQGTHIPSPAEVHAELGLPATWIVERADRPQREATGPDGQTATVTDNVLLIRRSAG
ncbi:class I SAM-dependent methyltransferase [Amycolatopsis tucumanensis]|uniref:Class I SAM-dependent methyltransferase n=1 Tax=Amycolatopsis tucumanensis TaxID=401106 RepID=A0ABP7HKN5_9PSEU|nr:class I SAM-dependent methyltransferase [Amycolatopsis tucumanensis]MCF6423561.1 methyltransferase domain-containing protein [Amycolatopsis tucumanensis]